MIIEVLVELSNRNVDKTFDYLVPLCFVDKIKKGIRVLVPFGNQKLEGFVLKIKNDISSDLELKEIIDVIDDDIILNDELLELGKFIKEKTLSTLISSYQVMLPKALKAKNKVSINKKMTSYLVLNDIDIESIKGKQRMIVDLIIKNGRLLRSDANQVSVSSVKTLLKNNIVREEFEEVYRYKNDKKYNYQKHELTDKQKAVVSEIMNYENTNEVFMLHGVTGSGKTEVYMELIDEMIKKNKTSIVLVPEISLTEQIVNRFRNRFDEDIAILHSRLSDGEKYDEWRRIARGEVKIVIGARSAIFAPLKNIGIIIIDEEFTSSYKQENNPKYHAIDVAKERCKNHNCPLVLGSATPTLENYARALKGVYHLIEMNERVNSNPLPEVKIVDMNHEMKKSKGHFSNDLLNSINNCVQKNEQVILLLNRRGYSSFVSCKECGYTAKCPNCDITLTYHKSSNNLRCHYCGYGTKCLDICPECHTKSICSLGIGTEKIEEELSKYVPEARVIRMDFDTTGKKGSHEKIIEKFRNHEYDILLGTQMIAKGLDFPNVTLVGVINADTSLNIPDFRSSEFTFQLLDQVAGRSGRGEKTGNVIIQTFNPDHYAIKYASFHDYKGFYESEMLIRQKLGYPPYYYMVGIKILSQDYEKARDESNKVRSYLDNNLNGFKILGPSVANVFKVNNIYRFQIIIKYKKEENLYDVLTTLIDRYKSDSKVKIDIDFNPVHL